MLPEKSGGVGTGGSTPGWHHAAARGGGSCQGRWVVVNRTPRSLADS